MADISLLHFDGADTDTTITDAGGVYTWTVVGDAQLDTTTKKFGTASLQLDGTGDGVDSSVVGSDALGAGVQGPWTIDFWVNLDNVDTSGQTILNYKKNSEAYGIRIFHQFGGGNRRIYCELSANGTSNFATMSGTIEVATASQWYHFALTYDDVDGKYYTYVDGVKNSELTNTTEVYNGTDSSFYLGYWPDVVQPIAGFIDELYITKTCRFPGGITFATFSDPYDENGGPTTSTAALSLPIKTIAAGSDGVVESFPIKTLLAGSDGGSNELLLKTLLAGNNGAASSLPIKTISGTVDRSDYIVSSLPLKTIIAGTAVSGGVATTGVLDLPAFTIVSTSEIGETATLAEAIPIITLEAGGNHSAYLEFPALTIAGTGLTGNLITSALSLYALDILATGKGVQIGQAANTLPLRQIISAAIAGGITTASITLPVRRLVSDGSIYHNGTATLVIPAFTISGIGGPNATLDAALTLPTFTLVAGGYHPKTGVYRSWAVNLRTGALSEYQQFDFNSYTKFNGLILAADANGIHTLGTEDLDNASNIDALFRTGIYGFDTSYVKRIPRLYLGYRADGTIEFSTITTHDGPRTYSLPANGNTSHHQRRVPIGKGPKSTYWQFQVANVDGADFSINSMLMTPMVIKRRSI